MPYETNKDLPDSVKDNLPSHAQDIYREAFNHAWQEYKDPAKRRKGGSQEEVSHRVAWSAVKEKYEKTNKGWVAK
ncbi:MAG: putative cation transport regulator [Gammaproteobacteria bacterium]|jgi:cation transport regulator|nr:putative cation transport regulator [Gammaproteobacteria bacterium]